MFSHSVSVSSVVRAEQNLTSAHSAQDQAGQIATTKAWLGFSWVWVRKTNFQQISLGSSKIFVHPAESFLQTDINKNQLCANKTDWYLIRSSSDVGTGAGRASGTQQQPRPGQAGPRPGEAGQADGQAAERSCHPRPPSCRQFSLTLW